VSDAADPRAALREAIGAFTRETGLAAAHRRLMDDHHRPVDWGRSGAAALPADLRAGLAGLWRARMISEHRSCGIFNLYALDLLGAGAPAEFLSLACRAALDEVRHAELFARVAGLYSGQVETPPPGIPPMPDDPAVPMRLQVAREALHLGVASETFSAVSLVEMHARAGDPVIRQVAAVVISDEIYHARMGWAFLASLLADDPGGEARGYLQGDLLPLFDDFVRDIFGDPSQLPPPSVPRGQLDLAVAHGYSSTRDEWRLFRGTLDEVWIPGLRALGLDTSALRDRYPAAG
jgi:hypothetical protein